MIELIILIIIPILWYIGGQTKGRIRDIPIPIILGLYFMFKYNFWLGLATMGSYQIIRLGYGNYDTEDDKPSLLGNLTKDESGEWIRLLYGFLVSGIGSMFVIYYTKNALGYLVYIGMNCLVNYSVSKLKLPVLATDLMVGLAVALVVFI